MLHAGVVLGKRWELVQFAGAGGMAAVWRSIDLSVGKTVAVKVLLQQFRSDVEYQEMFLEEARLGAVLHHPHIVRALDSGVDPVFRHFTVFEWVEGLSLKQYVECHARHGLATAWGVVVRFVLDALRGLEAAHCRTLDNEPAPVIHRDISPENILIDMSGRVKLADFGVSRARDRAIRSTRPGIVKGRLAYLSPELANGAPATVQSDIFALGAVLWEALAGRRLFEGSPNEVFAKISQAELTPLDRVRPDLPEPLHQAVAAALDPVVERRTPNAASMMAALEAALALGPRPPPTWIATNMRDARAALHGTAR